MMPPRIMFTALALSGAALLAACGEKRATPIDLARAPFIPTVPVGQTPQAVESVNSKTLLKQTGAAAAPSKITPTVYPPVKPGEMLSAETFMNRGGRVDDSIASPVKSLEACLNIAKERTYVNDLYINYTRMSVTTCIGEDGIARARFACGRAATGATACRPI